MIELSPDNEKYLESAVASGEYGDRTEALNEAVRLMRERDQKLAKLQKEIQKGIDSGPGIPAGEVFADLRKKAEEVARRAADQ